MTKIPPSDDPKKILEAIKGGKVVQVPTGPPRTHHQTTFQSTQFNISAAINDDGVVTGYVFSILDPYERHNYLMAFDQTVKDEFIRLLQEMPNQGEKIPEDDGTVIPFNPTGGGGETLH